ncbi:hypothetical protein FPP74_09105 [Corynebacterium sp. NML180780]|nr:hypothetical protein FPP74_09105 [Corynebacterium sp. NML180780]
MPTVQGVAKCQVAHAQFTIDFSGQWVFVVRDDKRASAVYNLPAKDTMVFLGETIVVKGGAFANVRRVSVNKMLIRYQP